MKCSCLCVLLVYATQRTANCVALAILICTYQLVNNIRARRGNACIGYLQRYTPEVQDRVPYSFGWIASPATRDCLSWHWISWRLLPLKVYVERLFSLCGDLKARKRNSAKVSLCWRVFLKLNRHILHWTQCTVNWSVTCFWYCRRAEDTLQSDYVFDIYRLTYLVSSLVTPHYGMV